MRAALVVLFALACTGTAEGDPTVTIVSPANGATAGTDVTLTVEVENFELVAPESARLERSHRRPVWTPLDLLPAAQAHDPSEAPQGYIEIKVDDVVVADTIELTTELDPLEAGAHSIKVTLFYPDGDSFFPSVDDEISITVQ